MPSPSRFRSPVSQPSESVASESGRLNPRQVAGEPRTWLSSDRRADIPNREVPSVATIIAASLVVGVLAGFLELLVFLVQRDVLDLVGLSTLFINRNTVWMIPVVETVGVLILGTAVGILFRLILPARAWKGLLLGLGTLLLLGPLLAVRGLHWAAALTLAIGVGLRLRGLLTPHAPKLRRSLRWVAPAAVLILTAHVAFQYDRIANAEAHAWNRSIVPPPSTPNLLFIVLDTVRADHLSLYGYHRETTPNLDRWAERSIVFDQARASAPWTLPSHMTMFTGLWPFEHRARIDRPYSGKSPLLSEHLHDHGFATAGFVANTGCCNGCFGFQRGFDRYVDHEINHEIRPYTLATSSALGTNLIAVGNRLGLEIKQPFAFRKLAPRMLDMTKSWIDHQQAAAPNRPFFAFVNLMDAHGPYRPPTGYNRAFHLDPVPDRPRLLTPEFGFLALQARDAATGPERIQRQAELDMARGKLIDLYDDCIRYLDQELGRFLDELEAEGRLDNTWVVITSDHGEHFGEHDRFGHGNSLYNELVHVPLMLIPPTGLSTSNPEAVAKGMRVPAHVSLRDLPNTLTGLLLSGQPNPFPGQTLARAWNPDALPKARPVDPIITQLEHQHLDGADAVQAITVHTMDAILDQSRMYIRTDVNRSLLEELYALDTDPAQIQNLLNHSEEQARLHQLRNRLNEIMGPSSAQPMPAN